MVATLQQRFLLERRSFRIDDDGVQVTYRRLFNDDSFKVPFERVPNETLASTRRQPAWLFLAAIFLAFLVGGVTALLGQGKPDRATKAAAVWGTAATLSGAAFFVTRRRFIAFATGDSSLVLLANSPSQSVVEAFVLSIREARDLYLRTRYQSPVPGESPVATLERLAALHDRGVLSDAEFESLKARIVGMSGPRGSHGGNYL